MKFYPKTKKVKCKLSRVHRIKSTANVMRSLSKEFGNQPEHKYNANDIRVNHEKR